MFISCNIPCYNSAFLNPDLVHTVKALTYLASLTFPDTYPTKTQDVGEKVYCITRRTITRWNVYLPHKNTRCRGEKCIVSHEEPSRDGLQRGKSLSLFTFCLDSFGPLLLSKLLWLENDDGPVLPSSWEERRCFFSSHMAWERV